MTIPLDEGFTVVTGPNGSGKSNILDGILFCLGLANSKGMRADRLPDLVNSGVLRAGKSAETVVSVRFDLSDWQPDIAEEGLEAPDEGPWIKANQKEWTVTRRLRVMPGGSYSSNYSADGEPCNLQQLQTQFRRLRIDPEGSNVVMQGDVTRIVSMSNRDRRGLIDELAGVALFDHRIEQTRGKLDDVHEKQERCRIVEQELLSSKQRLEKDCAKAKIYQNLREKLQLGRKHEVILAFEADQKNLSNLKNQYKDFGEKENRDQLTLKEEEKKLLQFAENLSLLQNKVKELGEDKLIAVQAELAGIETQNRELERQSLLHRQEGEKLDNHRKDLIDRKQKIQKDNDRLVNINDQNLINVAEKTCKEAEAAVEVSRRRLGDVAGRSGECLTEHRERSIRRQELQAKVSPMQNEYQKLEERIFQDNARRKEIEIDLERDVSENRQVHQQLDVLEKEWNTLLKNIEGEKNQLQELVSTLSIQQRTRFRLEQEQTKLEREIARIESRRETLQESRGIGALKLLLKAGIEGIHGSVSQLGQVDDRYRLALEVAAGSRLGQIVVDDDVIASKAIQLLKERKAGRLTFLPLNKMKFSSKRFNKAMQKMRPVSEINSQDGFIAKAVELVDFELIYQDVFSYIFGETLVFTDLNTARKNLGVNRLVTLDGELLEKSGAITGGSISHKNFGLTFGRSNDNDEAEPMRKRLLELGETLVQCISEENRISKDLDKARPLITKLEQRQAALDAERCAAKRANDPLLERRNERSNRLKSLIESSENQKKILLRIKQELEPLLLELKQIEEKEKISQSEEENQNWKRLEVDLEAADKALNLARNERDQLLNNQRLRQLEEERLADQYKTLISEEVKLKESINSLSNLHGQWRDQNQNLKKRQNLLEKEHQQLQISLGEHRRERDALEEKVAKHRQHIQEAHWNLDRLKEDKETLAAEIRNETDRLKKLEHDLPSPCLEIPEDVRQIGLEQLRFDLQKLQERMEALEPVNMLALDELDQLEQRLSELIERLNILNSERSELLLRIETVATLRQEAFMEAFKAVDIHFREIFASLSDGDGHLQLDNSEDPLEGGLTLVAHPKGKTVRRLAAMSGGEKSLTALSFLFALQRFRPSPFYALDEVDSFLDGVNVERLSALIARQAQEAQFLVVSHRRPMIGASSRTIGVTQARGAHTQVVGLPNAA